MTDALTLNRGIIIGDEGLRAAVMSTLWEGWRVVSAGIAVALVAILVVRLVFEARLREPIRRVLDLVAAPLFVLFLVYIATDFLRGPP